MADHDELLPRLARYVDYFQVLSEVAKVLTSNLHHDEVLNSIMQCLTQLVQPKNWSLMLVDESKKEEGKKELYFEIVIGEAAEALRSKRLKIGEGVAGWVAKYKRPVVAARVGSDPRFRHHGDHANASGASSVMCVPLICRDKLLGVLQLVRQESDPAFTEDDLEILKPFADFAAIAIDNARAFQRVEALTVIDDWTSLYNARFLDGCMRHEALRAMRYQHPLSIVFFDLDNFKQVNDTHGHGIGSQLLAEVGKLLNKNIRETDRAIRYGGDEFIIVMPETGRDNAQILARRLCQAIREMRIEVKEGVSARVTGSFGVATFPDDTTNAEALLELADRAMYQAKAAGRNRVATVTPEGETK